MQYHTIIDSAVLYKEIAGVFLPIVNTMYLDLIEERGFVAKNIKGVVKEWSDVR
jgi:hypothetical protein